MVQPSYFQGFMCQYKINIKQGQKDIDATTWMHVRDGITLTAWVDEWIMSCFPNKTPLYKCEGYSSVEKTKEKSIQLTFQYKSKPCCYSERVNFKYRQVRN